MNDYVLFNFVKYTDYYWNLAASINVPTLLVLLTLTAVEFSFMVSLPALKYFVYVFWLKLEYHGIDFELILESFKSILVIVSFIYSLAFTLPTLKN